MIAIQVCYGQIIHLEPSLLHRLDTLTQGLSNNYIFRQNNDSIISLNVKVEQHLEYPKVLFLIGIVWII